MANEREQDSVIIRNDAVYDKINKPVPIPKPEIGIDTEDTLIDNIVQSLEEPNNSIQSQTMLDTSAINKFTQVSQERNTLYNMLDTMCEDSKIAAILETYSEDVTEPNENGKIVWAESSDANCGLYINYLINILGIDKNIFNWANSLCKYGDIYIQLFTEAEVKKFESIFNTEEENRRLDEDIKVNLYKKSDKFVNYIEMYPNPAEMFELTKFGKSVGYIKTSVPTVTNKQGLTNTFYNYKFKQGDINIFPANKFVHASLGLNDNRVPETVTIFRTNEDYNSDLNGLTYDVKRGQSLFYKIYKVWRELTLLENSVLMNRLTRSSLLRIFNIQVGDMPKEKVGQHLLKVKQMIEQKTALTVGDSMNEYTSAGPYENFIYVPVHGEQGAITQEEIGGDAKIGDLPDLDYFTNLLYGGAAAPKQFFAQTDDSTGFNGGSSLSIISSRYAKRIKRIQKTLRQLITDLINIFLINKGMVSYINKFTIHMQPPTTQEELDRKDYTSGRVQITSDVMNLLNEVAEDPVTKMKILKSLLSNAITNQEVITLLQDEIDQQEQAQENGEIPEEEGVQDNEPLDLDIDINERRTNEEQPGVDLSQEETVQPNEEESNVGTEETTEEDTLPSPEELGIDMTSPDNF